MPKERDMAERCCFALDLPPVIEANHSMCLAVSQSAIA